MPKEITNRRDSPLISRNQEVIDRTDFNTMIPMHIVDNRSKAKELISEERNPENDWIDVILQYLDDEKLFPFLAE